MTNRLLLLVVYGVRDDVKRAFFHSVARFAVQLIDISCIIQSRSRAAAAAAVAAAAAAAAASRRDANFYLGPDRVRGSGRTVHREDEYGNGGFAVIGKWRVGGMLDARNLTPPLG